MLCTGLEPRPLAWCPNALTHYATGHLGGGVVTGLLVVLSDIPNNIGETANVTCHRIFCRTDCRFNDKKCSHYETYKSCYVKGHCCLSRCDSLTPTLNLLTRLWGQLGGLHGY